MVIDDVRALPHSPLVIAEGSTVPASALSSGVAEATRAVWLIPTEVFQGTRLAARGVTGGHAVLARLLGQAIEREAREHGAPTLTVDGSADVPEIVSVVEAMFAGAEHLGYDASPQHRR